MSLISNVLHHTIDSITSVSIDVFNTRTTTTVYTDVPCRWEKKTNVLTNRDAVMQIATVEVWLLPEYSDIGYDHEFVKDDEVYKVVGLDERYNLSGVLDHIKVYLA